MSDDNGNGNDNVTDMKPKGGKKTASSVLGEVKQQFMNKKAGDFKTKAAAVMEEIDKLNALKAVKEAELAKMCAEFDAEMKG